MTFISVEENDWVGVIVGRGAVRVAAGKGNGVRVWDGSGASVSVFTGVVTGETATSWHPAIIIRSIISVQMVTRLVGFILWLVDIFFDLNRHL